MNSKVKSRVHNIEVAELVRSRLFLGLFHEHENGAVKILLLLDGSSASGSTPLTLPQSCPKLQLLQLHSRHGCCCCRLLMCWTLVMDLFKPKPEKPEKWIEHKLNKAGVICSIFPQFLAFSNDFSRFWRDFQTFNQEKFIKNGQKIWGNEKKACSIVFYALYL